MAQGFSSGSNINALWKYSNSRLQVSYAYAVCLPGTESTYIVPADIRPIRVSCQAAVHDHTWGVNPPGPTWGVVEIIYTDGSSSGTHKYGYTIPENKRKHVRYVRYLGWNGGSYNREHWGYLEEYMKKR